MDGLAPGQLDLVRSVIAREWLRADTVPPELGSVTLRRHQLDAARRLRTLLTRSGGALLCDDVGLGKTYVALAVARSYGSPLVVAPASLRDMWLAAAEQTCIAIRFVSAESLSRGTPHRCDHELLVVDEAHHFRTPATARYNALVALAARTPILLLSATPLHNKRADMTALLSVFLGSAARMLSDAEIAKYVVRRKQSEMANDFPLVRPPKRITIPEGSDMLRLLLDLPPPTPARDGAVAAAIVAHTLVRLWASSDAALREGLRRRLAKTVAIRHALEAGRHPARRELDAWTYGDGAVQLGFASILASGARVDDTAFLDSAREHERALVDLIASLPRESSVDAARVDRLDAIRRRHAGARIVAFSQFAKTVSMFYRGFAREAGLAMLTSRGARIASGSITRPDALARFAPVAMRAVMPRRAEEITLLISTDLLSEGVNLQDAAVVVHLDRPWTAATLEQRVGRIARLGSRNPEVFVYSFDPPAPAEKILRAEAIIRRKAGLADASIGASRIPPLFSAPAPAARSDVEDAEALRRVLGRWIERDDSTRQSRPVCAAVGARRDGVLALVTVSGRARLVAGDDSTLSADPHRVLEIAELAHGTPARITAARMSAELSRARQWMERELGSDDAGTSRLGPTVLGRLLAARLARCLSACPLHERTHFGARVAAVHARIQSPLTLGVEREIEDLLRVQSGTPEFLEVLEQIVGENDSSREDSTSEIRAVLILKRCSRRVARESKK